MNEPILDDDTIEFYLQDMVQCLLEDLKKERVELEPTDIEYELFSRCEYLWVKAKKIYSELDTEKMIGVYRGYGGGGIHSQLIRSDIPKNVLSMNRLARASRINDIFEKWFWRILKTIDEAEEELVGQKKEDWERITI
jgi:hypothetical protein